MFPALATRILRTTDPRLLWKFCWNFGVKGLLSVERFKRGIKRGPDFVRDGWRVVYPREAIEKFIAARNERG